MATIYNREAWSSIRSKLNTLLSASAAYVTLTGTQTLTNKTLTSPVLTTPQINDTSADHQYVFAVSELGADRTVTLPLLTGSDEFVFKDHTVTLTNKTFNLSNNTLTGTTAQFNTALSDGNFATLAGSETLTNKTITSPIVSDLKIQDSDASHNYIILPANIAADRTIRLPALTGTDDLICAATTATLTNKSINLANNTVTGTTAEFNTALSDGNFATQAGSETLTNKTVDLGSNTVTGTKAQFDTACSDGDFAYQTDLYYDVRTAAGDKTVNDDTYLNQVWHITNGAASTFTLDGGASTFPIGGVVGVYNDTTSAGAVTLTAGAGVTIVGTATLNNQDFALVCRLATNLWVRIS